jgi:hypothetical protein
MEMKNLAVCTLFAAAFVLLPGATLAQTTSTASLTVTGTVESSITMSFVTMSGHVTVVGNSIDLGTVSAFNNTSGSFAPGVVRITNGNTFFASTDVGTLVTKANSSSAFYSLNASLVDSSDMASSLTWEVNGNPIGSTPVNVTSGMQYGVAEGQWITVNIPYTASPGRINAVITFVAIAE